MSAQTVHTFLTYGLPINPLWSAGVAVIVDGIIGDPLFIPHPVILMGKYISFVERHLNRPTCGPRALRATAQDKVAASTPSGTAAQAEAAAARPAPAAAPPTQATPLAATEVSAASPSRPRSRRRLAGIILTLSTIVLASVIPWLVLYLVAQVSVWLAAVVNIYIISTTIAWKGLVKAGRDVLRALQQESLEAARREVSMIVGRDTDKLPEPEVVRATVETLAENIVDAVVSPVFWACLGGAPLAMLYRAGNTLDSMVGYKNDRFRDFGWASARFDDLLNYIPARLTALLLWFAAWVTRQHARRAFRTMIRDAGGHPSPNSGISEAMVAGALGVQLGGVNYYGGVESRRALMGRPDRPLEREDIPRSIRLVHTTSLTLVLLVGLGGLLWLG